MNYNDFDWKKMSMLFRYHIEQAEGLFNESVSKDELYRVAKSSRNKVNLEYKGEILASIKGTSHSDVEYDPNLPEEVLYGIVKAVESATGSLAYPANIYEKEKYKWFGILSDSKAAEISNVHWKVSEMNSSLPIQAHPTKQLLFDAYVAADAGDRSLTKKYPFRKEILDTSGTKIIGAFNYKLESVTRGYYNFGILKNDTERHISINTDTLVNHIKNNASLSELLCEYAQVDGISKFSGRQIDAFQEAAYDAYKAEWLSSHLTSESIKQIHTDHIERLVEAFTDKQKHQDYQSYDEFIEENGYQGSIYSTYDNFLSHEFRDYDYMVNLVGKDIYETFCKEPYCLALNGVLEEKNEEKNKAEKTVLTSIGEMPEEDYNTIVLHQNGFETREEVELEALEIKYGDAAREKELELEVICSGRITGIVKDYLYARKNNSSTEFLHQCDAREGESFEDLAYAIEKADEDAVVIRISDSNELSSVSLTIPADEFDYNSNGNKNFGDVVAEQYTRAIQKETRYAKE